jgi:hypothetical protein
MSCETCHTFFCSVKHQQPAVSRAERLAPLLITHYSLLRPTSRDCHSMSGPQQHTLSVLADVRTALRAHGLHGQADAVSERLQVRLWAA